MPPKKKKAALKDQLAASEAQLAASEAQRAAADAEVISLRAALAAVKVSAVPSSQPRPQVFPGLSAALAASPDVKVCSPSKKGHLGPQEQRLLPNFASFDICSVPVTPSLASLSAAESLKSWASSAALLDEKNS